MAQAANDFDAIKISLASPDSIAKWSWGEVTKPETINYRTLRPEKDGLFCERIFGPTKDWECYCGKYKKIRFRGVTCDRCGVEVARSKVRRERMGHIHLAAPVAHIWFSKGTPSRLGLLLDLSPRNLDRVLYFAQYLVTSVDEEIKAQILDNYESDLETIITEKAAKIEAEKQRILEEIRLEVEPLEALLLESSDEAEDIEITETQLDAQSKLDEINDQSSGRLSESEVPIREEYDPQITRVEELISELKDLHITKLLTETQYRDHRDNFPDAFQAGMGAESVLSVLQNQIELDDLKNHLQDEMHSTSGQRRKKAIKRLRIVESFRKSHNKPEWMVLTNLPVLPPDLRPMVQLDGGRFATSDLNDLYRRVINRNNRLKRLIELQAPEIIVRNEKRMLQESVDALIDNGRRGRAVAGSHNHKLKSLSDLLRGKQGRFRQNLLGKRVDYSGRSVIIAGPELKLHQCGLPRRMALELFKPFVMHRLVLKGYAHNIRSAKRLAERNRSEVWDILGEVVTERPVLLNRAPTLHRLGIQAFEPVLIEGSAIRVHPLVCTAFNADFDGDQMAVHVPLSRVAVLEARRLMLSTFNMLAPSSGEPIVTPSLDMVLGCYYMTSIDPNGHGTGKSFSDFEDATLAYEVGATSLRSLISVRNSDGEWMETTVGRILFNDVLPEEIPFENREVEKNRLRELTSQCFRALGNERLAVVLDDIKSIGFKNASKSGVSIAINDVVVSSRKPEIVAKAEDVVAQLEDQYQDGLITDEEKYTATVKVWTEANEELTQVITDDLPNYGGIYMMANSGAKGNIAQIRQMAGMRGLMSNPRGRIIDRPIKSNFREGLTVLEYFISTHGARKGLADTALRTADSGYLTRRLIDVAQEVIVMEEDCNADQGLLITDYQDEALSDLFFDRIKYRYVAAPVSNPKTGEIIFESNHLIEEDDITAIKESGVTSAEVRSPLTCEAEKGLCRLCYGLSLANLQPIMIGDAVGIIAAQSIGEPGTQLTMRTFHTGGISGSVRSGEDKIYNISGVEEYPLRDTSTPGIITEYTPLIKEGEAVNIGTPIVQLKGAEEEEDDGIIHARDYGIASMGVVFPDKDLEQAIRDELDKQQGVLTRADLKRLKKLETREKLEDYKNEIKEDKIAVTGLAYTSLIKEGEAVNVGARIAQRKAVKGDDGIISAGNSGIANIEKGRITIAGVAVKRDITGVLAGSLELGGLPRVEELFEARSPKGAAVLSEISGTAEIIHSNEGRTVRILNSEELADEYTISGYTPLIKKGDTVIIGTPIAKLKGAEEEEDDGIIHARNSGLANIKKGTITITWTDEERREYPVPAASHIEISDGDFIEAGQGITSGPKNPQQILEIQGREAVQTYLIEEVQKVYRSQGVPIHDKHIEAIIRQMLRRVQVNEAGDTDFLPGDPMGRREFEEKNAEIIAEGGDPATAVPILLGITRASLHMDSFLAAASFQETTRVLTESAVMGKRDMLTGLKENVIIGRLIPARYDNTIEGKEKLGLNELEELLELEDIPDSPPPPEFEDKEGNIIPVTQFKANPKEEMEEIPGD